MSDSEFSSSESEEKIYIENVNPTLENLFPLEINGPLYFAPLSSLKLSPKTKLQIRNLIKCAPALQLRKILFWQIFCKKLKDSSTTEVQNVLSKLLSQSYAALMLLKLKDKFDEALDILPIIFGHSIHYELWDIFKHSQHTFDMRFCIDCYKIIYFNLLGLKVSDIFVKSTTHRVLGDYFMYYYSRKSKPTHTDKKNYLSKAIEEKMEEFPGGKEFARELFQTSQGNKSVVFEQSTVAECIALDPSDQLLQDRVDSHLSDPPLRKSFLDNISDKTFNCVKLSPMLCGYIDSSTKQVPFKVRHITPHKSQVVQESAPSYVKILKQHCDEKRSQSASKIRRETIRKTKKPGFTRVVEGSLRNLAEDPRGSECYEEVFRLQSKLNEAFPIKLLYTNRSKYGL